MGITLGACTEYNDTNTIFGEITSDIDILDIFIYKTYHYHDGTTLLKCTNMEILVDPFETVCKKLRREVVLGLTEKEEQHLKTRKKQREKDQYVKHESEILKKILN